MSWNIQTIQNVPADKARKLLTAADAPAEIKSYITDGLEGLVQKYGENVMISVTAYGHVCDGKSYDVTSATIIVQKAPR